MTEGARAGAMRAATKGGGHREGGRRGRAGRWGRSQPRWGGRGGGRQAEKKKNKGEEREQELGRTEGETSNRNLSASIAPRGYHRAAYPPRVNGGRPNRCDSTRHAAGAASVLVFFFIGPPQPPAPAALS